MVVSACPHAQVTGLKAAGARLPGMELYRIIYASRARLPVGCDITHAIEDILAPSQRKNAAVGVTGLLLHHQSVFIQALEGHRPEVERVYRRVSRDLRHEHVTIVSAGPAAEREFARWSMCARTIRAADARILDLVGGELADIGALEPEATLNLLCAVEQMREPGRRAA